MKFKSKYKYREREQHFRVLERARKLKESLEKLILWETPFISAYGFKRGKHWSDKDLSVIGQHGGTPS